MPWKGSHCEEGALGESRRRTSLRHLAGAAIIVCLAAVAAAPVSAIRASAYTTPPDIMATDYVVDLGFGSGSTTVGPVGLAFDQSGNLFVTDYLFGVIYRIPPHTGQPTSAYDPNLPQGQVGQRPTGLAFIKDGHLYMAHQGIGSTP